MNLHTPQRTQSESFKAYRERRQQSRLHAEAITLTGHAKDKGQGSRQAFRNELRNSGSMKKHASSYGRGLRNWINRKQQDALFPMPG